MIETAQQVVVLTISEKINSAQRFNVCPVTEIHVLVTELDLYDPRLTEFSAKGLNVL